MCQYDAKGNFQPCEQQIQRDIEARKATTIEIVYPNGKMTLNINRLYKMSDSKRRAFFNALNKTFKPKKGGKNK